MATFYSSFWASPDPLTSSKQKSSEEDNTGFLRILDRLRFGRRQTEDLIAYFTLRLSSAETMRKSSIKLSKMKFRSEIDVAKDKTGLQTTSSGKSNGAGDGEEEELVLIDDPRCLAVAMQALSLQAREEAEIQNKLIEVLKEIIATLKESIKDQERTKHKYKVHVKEATERKQGHKKRATKAQDLAYKRCKEKDALLTVNPESMDRRKAEKHEEKLRQARKTASAADLEYRHQVDRTVEAYGLWKTDMSESLGALQGLEMGRLECLADLLNSYCMLASQSSQSIADSLNHLRNNRVAVLNAEDEIQLFIAKRQTGNCIPEPPRYHSYYVDEEMVRAGSIIAPVAPSHGPANEIASDVWEEVDRCERLENFKPANVPVRSERKSVVNFSEPVYKQRETSIASTRRDSTQRDSGVNRLERSMSRVSIKTTPQIHELSPPRSPSPMRTFDFGGKVVGVEHNSSPNRASSVTPSMQSITARNAKPGIRRSTMLSIDSVCSSDDSDSVEDAHCVIESRGKVERSPPSTPTSMSSLISKKVPFKAIAIYDYTARDTDELSFRKGDGISVTDCSDDPWWYGTIAGKGCGSFPSNYVST